MRIDQITRRQAGTGDDIVIDETSETTIKQRSIPPTEFVIDENDQYPLKFRPAVPRGATLQTMPRGNNADVGERDSRRF